MSRVFVDHFMKRAAVGLFLAQLGGIKQQKHNEIKQQQKKLKAVTAMLIMLDEIKQEKALNESRADSSDWGEW